jgi:hypothetical protein
MAFIAGKAFLKNQGVVIARRCRFDERCLLMTIGAACGPRREGAVLEVTEEAGGLGHSDMLALDDLGMAARTAELLAPFEVGEMGGVVENDRLELDLPLEEPFIVAA